MLDRIRSKAYGVLASTLGDRVAPVRWTKAAARYVNDVVGRPLAPADELAERAAFEARTRQPGPAPARPREAAPVVVFHIDRHHRELQKIVDMLGSRDIPFQVRNVEGDEASISAVTLESKGHEMPVVFIAGAVVGGLQELVNMDKRGELMTAVYGD